ncbi:MAG: aminoglycoside phosphotransferase family protein [Candidatus Sericytochromatia bacterium]|uniref:Aminoglycoside phosphotransferase family protein n=1 Tax=Candidatus Tanganyikabacteria bacterium TaxID=2961651 RepID=A0A937X839_9BACT|nr:aminoglycoside phosphotransferase family protein [Candidatus Tanganyikabacteria bacterium]
MDQESQVLHHAASQFLDASARFAIREFGNGNINRTYLVTPAGHAEPFLLQRINTRVFRQPELVMQNIAKVMRHLDGRPTGPAAREGRRWEVPHVLLCSDGTDHCRTADGGFWRAQRYIAGTRTIDAVQHSGQAREVGYALGTFHAMLSDLPIDGLADTLPGFHVAPEYLAQYDRVLGAGAVPASEDEEWCASFIASHRDWVPVLEDARARGVLRLRPIHGDPKVNNILFDGETGHAVAMVDLDTLKPGLVQYDIGDCLRSSCNPDGEETPGWRDVRFDPVLGRAVLEGYLEVARAFFDDADFDFLPDSVRLIAFELGLRFFTDHLAGDTYFKVGRRGQNLARALVQLRLAQRIDERFEDLRDIVAALR